jgi:hypothetical protein
MLESLRARRTVRGEEDTVTRRGVYNFDSNLGHRADILLLRVVSVSPVSFHCIASDSLITHYALALVNSNLLLYMYACTRSITSWFTQKMCSL